MTGKKLWNIIIYDSTIKILDRLNAGHPGAINNIITTLELHY